MRFMQAYNHTFINTKNIILFTSMPKLNHRIDEKPSYLIILKTDMLILFSRHYDSAGGYQKKLGDFLGSALAEGFASSDGKEYW